MKKYRFLIISLPTIVLIFSLVLVTGCLKKQVENNIKSSLESLSESSDTQLEEGQSDIKSENKSTEPKITNASGMIAFARSEKGWEAIYVMNEDGSSAVKIKADTDLYLSNVGDPAISPDGSKIVFEANFDIFITSVDGSDVINLTNTQDENDINPSFSPDGTKIVFHSVTDISRLYIMNSDGSQIKELNVSDVINNYDPCFSSDGSKIIFASDGITKDKGDWPGIYIMNPDGSGLKLLARASQYFRDNEPTYSPDGSKIAVSSYISEGHDIMILNSDGSGITNLTNNPSAQNIEPHFSKDGSKIFFQTGDNGEYKINVMNIDGSGVTTFTNDSNIREYFSPYVN